MINPVLFSLTTTIAIHWYGIMIAIGAALSLFFIERTLSKQKLVSAEQFHNLVLLCFVSGALGGKFVYLLTEAHEGFTLIGLLNFFEGGLSILGTVTAVAVTLVTYLAIKQKPILPVADVVALYAPIIQGFGRIGCLLAGCCYGLPTTAWFAITYTHVNHLAPLNIPLHPTQLYSACVLFTVALLLQISKRFFTRPGQLTMLYFMLIGLERFIVDFWRNDRVFVAAQGDFNWLSFHQLYAIAIIIIAACLFSLLSYRRADESL